MIQSCCHHVKLSQKAKGFFQIAKHMIAQEACSARHAVCFRVFVPINVLKFIAGTNLL